MIDSQALERVRAHVIASGSWPLADAVVALDAGDGRVHLRWAFGPGRVASAIVCDVRLIRDAAGRPLLVAEDEPEPDFDSIVPVGVVRVVARDPDLVLDIPLGPRAA